MKKIMSIFLEPDGSFSWRKAMTFATTLLFAFAVIGNQLYATPKFSELPTSYIYIIGGVFAFYFGKEIWSGLGKKIGGDNNKP